MDLILTNKEDVNIKKNKEVDYDQFLSSAGEFGRYQVFLFFATFPFYMFGVFSFFSQLFMTESSPNHWCWIPELENLTDTQRRNLAIPLDSDSPYGYSRCEAYDANWTEVLSAGLSQNQTWKTIPCKNGWEFNITEFPYPTISTELGWVCERDSYQATAQSFYSVGSIVGGFLVGWVADRFGRIPASVCANMLGCVAGIASVFATNLIEFTVCRFIMGMSYDNCMMMTYLLVLEYVAPKYRTIITNLSFGTFFSMAAVALPWIALLCGHWKTLSLVTSIPMALSLLAPLIIPESPLWLLSKGRVDDTVNNVLNIARVNKQIIAEDTIENFKYTAASKKQEEGIIIEMLKRPLLRRIFICICLEYLFAMIIFDSLVRTIGQLKSDFFISFSVISITEFPSLVILAFVLDYTGRKRMVLMTFITAGVFSFLIPFVGTGLPSVSCAVVARFAINMTLNTCMQWAAELFPTLVRGSGTAIVHIFGYIATVMSPFVAYLEIYHTWLPMVVVGMIGITACLIGILLPETVDRDIPQTFEDAEELVKSQRLFDFVCKKKDVSEIEGHANADFVMN